MSCTSLAAAAASHPSFNFDYLAVFRTVPEEPGFGVASLQRFVVVYDHDLLSREGIIEGCLYVRESQCPRACMSWDHWLELEWRDEDRRHRLGPRSSLAIKRDVVQATRVVKSGLWAVRLADGYIDGPYHDWAFGQDFIGKVVGVYRP